MDNENKEMDLFDLLKKVGEICESFIGVLGSFFLWLIRFLVKNWLLLSFFTLLGLGLAYFSLKPNNRTNYVEFNVHVNGTKSFVVFDILRSLSQKIDYDNGNQSFAKVLGINQELVKPLQIIEPVYIIDIDKNGTPDIIDFNNSYLQDTSTRRMRHFLHIRIQAKGETNFSLVQKAIVDYLKKDAFLIKEENERLRLLKNEISVLDNEIELLDSIRRAGSSNKELEFSIANQTIIFEKPTYHKDIISLEKKRDHLYEIMALQPDVITIYSDVIRSTKNSKKEIYLTRVIPLFVFGFLLALLISYRREIKKILIEK